MYDYCRFKNWENIIESLLKENNYNNCLSISGNYKVERLNEIKEIKSQINELMDKKWKWSIILSNEQCTTFQKNNIKRYRSNHGRKHNRLTSLMDSTLIYFGIDRTMYHGCCLERTSILKLFQNSNKIFHVFQTKNITIITDDLIFNKFRWTNKSSH